MLDPNECAFMSQRGIDMLYYRQQVSLTLRCQKVDKQSNTGDSIEKHNNYNETRDYYGYTSASSIYPLHLLELNFER